MNSKHHNKFFDDDLFFGWYFFRSDDLNDYWKAYLRSHPEDKSEFDKATELSSHLSFNEYALDPASRDKVYSRIMSSVLRKRIARRLASACAAAAVIVGFVLAVLFSGKYDDEPVNLAADTILGKAIPPENVQLISGDNVMELPESETIVVSSDGKLSLRSQGEVEVAPVEKHKLIVPYGKQSVVTLSDGSKMWINSGSEVEFPSKFTGAERTVEVNGEVYIEVFKDKTRPFRIHSDDLSVTVLGTKFNFSSYKDNENKYVVLVEGSVEVSSPKGGRHILKPNQMLLCDSGGEMQINTVDTWKYTSWKDGVFIFDQTPLQDVLEKISRYYNIEFCNNSSQLMKLTCTGRLYLPDNIDQVMNTIAVLSGTTYERKDNFIYINSK